MPVSYAIKYSERWILQISDKGAYTCMHRIYLPSDIPSDQCTGNFNLECRHFSHPYFRSEWIKACADSFPRWIGHEHDHVTFAQMTLRNARLFI